MVHVIDASAPLPEELRWDAAWLGGMYDGEGSGNHIAQSLEHNPEVHARIERVISALGFGVGRHEWGFYIQSRDARVRPGSAKQTYVDFLNWTRPTRRSRQLDRMILGASWRQPDKVAAIRPLGRGEVVSMQTTTGNYVAWGYASKNCQFVETEDSAFRYDDIAAALDPDLEPLFAAPGWGV